LYCTDWTSAPRMRMGANLWVVRRKGRWGKSREGRGSGDLWNRLIHLTQAHTRSCVIQASLLANPYHYRGIAYPFAPVRVWAGTKGAVLFSSAFELPFDGRARSGRPAIPSQCEGFAVAQAMEPPCHGEARRGFPMRFAVFASARVLKRFEKLG
jgi:hypothetical protein